MIGMVKMGSPSNRDVERLYEKYNPENFRAGELVKVVMNSYSYSARIVGLDLDLKNKKVYANLKLLEQNKRHPIRVDVADCIRASKPLYLGHHYN